MRVGGFVFPSMRFEFNTPTRIICEPGAFRSLGPLVRHLMPPIDERNHRALIVTGRLPRHSEALMAAMQGIQVDCVFHAVSGEPDIECIETGTSVARREQCRLVVAIGGGSVLDAGKAIAAMMANDGDLLEYLEIIGRGKPLAKRPAPFVAIPTTAGTGSEVTRNSVIASPERRVKVSLRSPLMSARIALVDPALALSLPPDVTASTGLDALTQLIEPYVCLRANPLTDALCLEGIERAARSLAVAVEDGRNLRAREDMAVASLFSGLALSNAGLGAVHGLAGPIGGMFPAPHGAICAALLPHIMEANILALRERDPNSASLKRYQHLAQRLANQAGADAMQGVEFVHRLSAQLKVSPLAKFGITPAHIPEIVEKAAHASSMKANPIALTPGELGEAVRRAL